MANLYVNDDTLMEYADEYGSVDAAKKRMQAIIEENTPGDNDD